MKKAVTYGAGLIALYLAVAYASGTEGILAQFKTGSTSVIKALQGR
jgi:hypothetical protein